MRYWLTNFLLIALALSLFIIMWMVFIHGEVLVTEKKAIAAGELVLLLLIITFALSNILNMAKKGGKNGSTEEP